MMHSMVLNSKCLSVFFVIVAFICVHHKCTAFNLSPKPNLVIHEPKAKVNTGLPKIRSSYFGFSINLKRNSIFIGAPRAQSTLEKQRAVNESGAIYKCNLAQKSDNAICDPFIFDEWGNIDNMASPYTYDNEKKDYQWLGAAMDSNANDTDKFVVCAPRLVSNIIDNYLMHGVCYWTTNTSMSRPPKFQKIAPLRLKDKQQIPIDNSKYFFYMFGEQGISVHITENNEEIIIGAPGVFLWKGTVVRHQAKPLADLGGLSRRNENAQSFRRQKRSNEPLEYSSDVPNPSLWNQDDNSYFGFAVSSGYFDGPNKTKLLYVASAPQANEQQGEVYIFDIVDHHSATDKTIKIYHKFSGQSFGEYFGYSLITEDFHNDGFTDVAIAAPYNSKSGSYENGAVYIYKNEQKSLNFVLQTILQTDYEFSGHFGITMSKVGDLNNDGYNDLVVAAPFEDNGAVYIYHGSANGLSIKPSQKIIAPRSVSSFSQMFGHGLSKGVDTDGNQYLDIAIGSPNTDTVYIFRSYPVVRAITSIVPESQEITTTDTSFKFKVCWMYESAHTIDFDVNFNATIKLDTQLSRASFNGGKSEFVIYDKITTQEQCKNITASVKYSAADIFKPIDIELSHTILNGIPDYSNSEGETQEFCKSCVAVNPNEARSIKNKIVFSTGCKTARCVADLILKSELENIPRPYILGSSSSLAINYDIENSGETAYLAQINITLPSTEIKFAKIPSNCKLAGLDVHSNTMECDLNDGRPMYRGDRASLKIAIDVTKVDGEELVIKAQVHSTGDELNELDNKVKDIIPLAEFSEIEVLGNSIDNRLTFENTDKLRNVTHTFEIRNNGPSNVKSLEIRVLLPISYVNPVTLERKNLIDIDRVSMKGIYNSQKYDVEWTQNSKILILDAIESTTTTFSNVPIEDNNGMQFDASKMGLEYDLNGGNLNVEELSGRRKRRSVPISDAVYYNQYLRKVMPMPTNGNEYSFSGRYKRDIFGSTDHLLANLPVNRTTYFDCRDPKQNECLQARFVVMNFRTTDAAISITLHFTIDMDKIANVLTEKHDILVIRSSADLIRISDKDKSTLNIVQHEPFSIISKYAISSTPLWVYIVSIIVGILSLILISYAMHKFGFFRRQKRDELVKLKRRSEAMSYYPKEDEDQF